MKLRPLTAGTTLAVLAAMLVVTGGQPASAEPSPPAPSALSAAVSAADRAGGRGGGNRARGGAAGDERPRVDPRVRGGVT
ncbi:hypothetical protein ACFV01_26900, partial [Streptomyces sp. NPDC059616]